MLCEAQVIGVCVTMNTFASEYSGAGLALEVRKSFPRIAICPVVTALSLL
jgi:hypothetical protein